MSGRVDNKKMAEDETAYQNKMLQAQNLAHMSYAGMY